MNKYVLCSKLSNGGGWEIEIDINSYNLVQVVLNAELGYYATLNLATINQKIPASFILKYIS